MKATLEFELPEENDEFEDAIQGYKYSLVIYAIKNRFRQKWKHSNDEKESEFYGDCMGIMQECLDEYDVHIL